VTALDPVTALDTGGPAAPPRANGELVFAEPWESRAFAMAVTLAEAGVFTWDEFRESLVGRIAADPGSPYYRCWLAALEDRVVAAGALDEAALTERTAHLAGRSPGHDHAHGHGH
jgi:nitrile hydratase accessory protein